MQTAPSAGVTGYNTVATWVIISTAVVFAGINGSSKPVAESEYRYAVLTASIASANGYSMAERPDTPADLITPPLYPIIASVFLLATDDIAATVKGLRLFNLVFLAGVLWVCRNLFIQFSGALGALLLTAILAATPVIMAQAYRASPLFLVTLGSLLMLFYLARGTGAGASGTTYFPFNLGVLCGVLTLGHLSALAISATVLIRIALGRKLRDTCLLVVGWTLIAAPWIAWTLLAVGDSYSDLFLRIDPDLAILGTAEVSDVILRIIGNTWQYLSTHMGAAFVPMNTDGAVYWRWISIGLTILAVYGVYLALRKSALGLYGMIMGMILLLNPAASHQMLLPMVPILLIGLLRTTEQIMGPSRPKVVLVLLGIVMVTSLTAVSQITWTNFNNLRSDSTDIVSAAGWLQAQTNQDDILMCIETATFFSVTGRKCVPPPAVPTPGNLSDLIIRYGIDYVVSSPAPGSKVSDLNALLIEPIARQFDEVFIPVYRSSGPSPVTIYKVAWSSSNQLAHLRLPR